MSTGNFFENRERYFGEPGDKLSDALSRDDVTAMKSVPNWVDRVSKMYKDKKNADFLFEAIDHDRHLCLDQIFENCPDIPMQGEGSSRCDDGNFETTPFLFAISQGSLNFVQMIIKQAAKRDDVDLTRHFHYYWVTAADAARATLRPDNADLKMPGWMTDYGPIAQAICYGQFDVLRVLLDDKLFDVNDKGFFGFETITPIFMALHPTKEEFRLKTVTELMKDERVDLSIVDHKGNTPLHRAIELKCDSVVIKLLIVDRLDLTIKNHQSKTVLQMAQGDLKKTLLKFSAKQKQNEAAAFEENKRKAAVEEAKKLKLEKKRLRENARLAEEAAKTIEVIPPSTDQAIEPANQDSTIPPQTAQSDKGTSPFDRFCQNCYTSKESANILLQPCNHLALCHNCSEEARKNKRFNCPICRQRVSTYLRLRF